MSNLLGGIQKAVTGVMTHGLDTGAKPVPVLQDSGTSGTKGTSFGDALKGAINQVSDQQDVANDYAARFVRGEPVELHQVMASAEEASISLDMLVQVRNKFLDAYHTVINMQS